LPDWCLTAVIRSDPTVVPSCSPFKTELLLSVDNKVPALTRDTEFVGRLRHHAVPCGSAWQFQAAGPTLQTLLIVFPTALSPSNLDGRPKAHIQGRSMRRRKTGGAASFNREMNDDQTCEFSRQPAQ
jgi:hypothetical protein